MGVSRDSPCDSWANAEKTLALTRRSVESWASAINGEGVVCNVSAALRGWRATHSLQRIPAARPTARPIAQHVAEAVLELARAEPQQAAELGHGLLVGAEIGALEIAERERGAVERCQEVLQRHFARAGRASASRQRRARGNAPCADDALLAAALVERLADAVDGIDDAVDVGVDDLQLLRVAVDGPRWTP